jgi:archaellum biogenesis ATPase FlaH
VIYLAILKQALLAKSPTGIEGLDEITFGGLPTGRPTLVSGSAGTGKTILAMEFLIRGAVDYNEPGVFMAFEETEKDLTENLASLGYDLEKLQRQKKLAIDHVRIERDDVVETGGYNLDGLFIRLGNAVDSIHARRVVLDTIEVLFSSLEDRALIRSELLRLFRWLKDRGLTVIITGERGTFAGALWPGRVCRRLRHRARSSRNRSDLNAPAADCEISRKPASDRRASLPDHRSGIFGHADYLRRPDSQSFKAAHFHGRS